VNFLRTTSTRRLIAGAALTTAVVVGGVAVAAASGSGGTPPPPKALDVAVHDALTAPKPVGITARIQFTNNLIASGVASTGSPLLSGASGRLWVGDGRARLELQSDAGDAQIGIANGHLSVYDASSNTMYTADLGSGSSTTGTGTAHAAPTVADISKGLAKLATEATLSGAVPTTQAGQGAYSVSVTPKHDAGLLGQASLVWDAATGVPLKVAVTAAGSSTPVLALEVTDITYGAVDSSALTVTAPAGAKVVDLGSMTGAKAGDTSHGPAVQGLPAVQAAVPFTVTAPDTLVGLPRTDVRLVRAGSHPAVLVTYGQGLGAIAVLERPAGSQAKGSNPLASLPSVTIDGATGHELPTALGTIIAVDRGQLSYILLGSLPPNAAEAALREVLK
jgi:hypothetical protein